MSQNECNCDCCKTWRRQRDNRVKELETFVDKVVEVGYPHREDMYKYALSVQSMNDKRCIHGKGKTEYCEPCGRIHSG